MTDSVTMRPPSLQQRRHNFKTVTTGMWTQEIQMAGNTDHTQVSMNHELVQVQVSAGAMSRQWNRMHNLVGRVPSTKGRVSAELQWQLLPALCPGISMTTTPWGRLICEPLRRLIISMTTISRQRQIEGFTSTETCRRKNRPSSRATFPSWTEILMELRWEKLSVVCKLRGQ